MPDTILGFCLPTRHLAFRFLLGTGVLIGCGDSPGHQEPDSLTTILVEPVAALLQPNWSQVFVARCLSNGTPFPCPDLTWTVTGGTWAGAPVVPDTAGTFTAGSSLGAFSVAASSAGVSGMAPVTVVASVPANVTVNPLVLHQVIDGWEATAADGFSATQSTMNALIAAAANDLGITRLRLEATGNKIESRDGITGTNDNSDPATLNAAGFYWGPWDQKITRMVVPLKQAVEARGDKFILNVCYVGFDDSSGFQQANAAEYAEFVLTVLKHLKQTFGLEPDIWEVRLEPNTPNYTIDQTTETAMMAAAVAAARQAGFNKVMFAAPSPSKANLAVSFFNENITAPNASQYLRELVYHRYGTAPTQTVLNGIRTAALNFGAHTAMLEHIGADQNELYEDLTQADVSSWQQYTLAFSGPDVGGKYYVVNAAGTGFSLGSRTRFLRQYFHYVRPGDRRVDATSTNATIRPVAFVKPNGKVVVVANTTAAAILAIAGLPAGTYQVSYTTAGQAAIGTTSTIVAGQVLQGAIPAAGVITIAPQ
jgi:hypothetical protein